MPFTLTHPALVVFNKNKNFNLLALILGSMAPDFIYFILFNPSSNLGHTLNGFVFINLPLCFLLSYILTTIIKYPFISNLPFGLSKYYTYLLDDKNKSISLKNVIVFTYSSLIGMLTHVFWDSFTHKTGFFVKNIKFLTESFNILSFKIPIYKILQHGSTIIGFFIILAFLYSIKKISYKKFYCNKVKYHLIALIFLILTLILSYILFNNFGIGRFVVTIVNGLFLGYFISSLILIEKY